MPTPLLLESFQHRARSSRARSLFRLFAIAVGLSPVLGRAQTLLGDNQSALEFGYSCEAGTPTAECTGTFGTTYTAPDPTHAITVLHASVIRLPFLIERAQPTAMGSLDAKYLGYIKQAATTALNLGSEVVLDPHNFGFVYGQDITTSEGQAAYLDFEQQFNTWVAGNFTSAQLAKLAEGLMNEPHTQSDSTYQPVFQQAVDVIRAAGFRGPITYPAAGWSAINAVTADSAFMQGVVDPSNNLMAELHGYWDADNSGTHNTCITDPNLGHARMDGAIAWSTRTGIKIFWGETAEPESTPQPAGLNGCYVQSDQYFRSFMQEAMSSGRFWGITLWGDGPWWGSNYFFVLTPVNGTDTADALTLESLMAQTGTVINPAAWYSVVNTNSGLCLDDWGYKTANGTTLRQFTCGASQTNQQWQLVPTDGGYSKVVSRNGGLVWDVTGGPDATGNSTPVQLWSDWGGTNQQWMPVSLGGGLYKFVARHSGFCLDVPDASTETGVQLQQYTCNGTGAQSFTLLQKP